MLLVQVINPKIRCMDDDQSLLGLDVLRDIYALTIYSSYLSRERQENQFLTYVVPKFQVGH